MQNNAGPATNVPSSVPWTPDSLVISGGGIKGFAFFGALKALSEECGWDFGRRRPALKRIVGVSIGAFVGMLLALEFSADELLDAVRSIEVTSFVSPNPTGILLGNIVGLDDGATLEAHIEQYLMGRTGESGMTLKQLRDFSGLDFSVGVVDVEAARFVELSPDSHPDLSVSTAVRASMALPPLFAPLRLPCGLLAADGGLLNNFPLTYVSARHSATLGLRIASPARLSVNPASLSYLTRVSALLTCPLEEAQWACTPAHVREKTITIMTGGIGATDLFAANDLAVRVSLVAMGMECGRDAVQCWRRGLPPRDSEAPSLWIDSLPDPLSARIIG